MNKQLGASFTVKGYLLIMLIAVAAMSGATSLWLSQHRDIVVDFSCRS